MIPVSWKVILLSRGETPDSEALDLRLESIRSGGFESTAMAFWRARWKPWGREISSSDEATLCLSSFPGLDELYALFMMARASAGEPLPEPWEAMCRYCADVRQGFLPDRTSPELAIQSVYVAIAQYHLLAEPPAQARFLDDALGLCATVSSALDSGAKLLDDPILANEPRFERYVDILRRDREAYQDDLARAQRFIAVIPGEHDPKKAERELPMLVLDHPTSTQFKLWARTDPEAPTERGYPLLLVALAGSEVVLSADPRTGARVGWLASGLTARERESSGKDEATWYDGANHSGTLMVSPRPGGTSLPLGEVVDHLRTELSLRPVRESRGRGLEIHPWMWAAAGGLALAAVAGVAGVAWVAWDTAAGDEIAYGPTMEADEILALRGGAMDGSILERHALLIGCCDYPGDRHLDNTCEAARQMGTLLVEHYGYDADNVRVMVDDGNSSPDDVPTATNIRIAIEELRETVPAETSFLFFYSGHGENVRGARRRYGILQPTGFFSSDRPEAERGFEMAHLREELQNHVRSRHVMMLIDACKSGWSAHDPGGSRSAPAGVLRDWANRTEVVLTSSSQNQTSWSDRPEFDGLTAMSVVVIEGLTPGPDGSIAADLDGNSIVTDEELAMLVRREVPLRVAAAVDGWQQTPQFHRFPQQDTPGQFLFIPGNAEPPD